MNTTRSGNLVHLSNQLDKSVQPQLPMHQTLYASDSNAQTNFSPNIAMVPSTSTTSVSSFAVYHYASHRKGHSYSWT